MNTKFSLIARVCVKALILCIILLMSLANTYADDSVSWWISAQDKSSTLTPGVKLSFSTKPKPAQTVITIDPSKTYQSIIGIGSSLEHSTCYNIGLLPYDRQERLMESIVCPKSGIGMNLMRICIGTADFTASPWYSYNDPPNNEPDPQLKYFSIEKDRDYVLPILKLALKKNPRLRFHASPWSPPAWMKTNKSMCGGHLDPKYYRVFAEYLARFIEAYRAEGIDVFAITPQNEPEYFPDTYPTCGWRAEEQRDFIRDHLGPVFEQHKLDTLIWCYDHNFNHPQYPITILSDPRAARYVDGSAFHLYEGHPEAMTLVHKRFPEKHLYFTEGSTFDIVGATEIISYFHNWARCYNAWVTIIDHKMQPNPGPHDCSPTCIVLNSETLKLDYRFDYYMYGHFMKFIKVGAKRIDSSPSQKSLPNVAFRNPDSSIVVVMVNPLKRPQNFAIGWQDRFVNAQLGPLALATFSWKP